LLCVEAIRSFELEDWCEAEEDAAIAWSGSERRDVDGVDVGGTEVAASESATTAPD
jgi:hypothetical protein